MHEDCALFPAQNTGNIVVPDECIHKREADYARLSLPFRNLRASRSKQVDCLPRNGKKKKAFRSLIVQVTESSFQLIGVAVIEFYSSLNPPH